VVELVVDKFVFERVPGQDCSRFRGDAGDPKPPNDRYRFGDGDGTRESARRWRTNMGGMIPSMGFF
jgi:hypothetical protein